MCFNYICENSLWFLTLFRNTEQSTPLSLSPQRLPPTQSRSSSVPVTRSLSPAGRPKASKQRKHEADELLVLQIEKLTSERDEASSFGEHVASRLQQFTPIQRARACMEIDKVLYDIQFPNEPVFTPPPANMSYSSFATPTHYPHQQQSHDNISNVPY